jgi:hypothetical protein
VSWNYRIMRHESGFYAIHEVYYDDAGIVKWWTGPIEVISDSEEGMLGVLSRMREAGSKSTLSSETGKSIDCPSA